MNKVNILKPKWLEYFFFFKSKSEIISCITTFSIKLFMKLIIFIKYLESTLKLFLFILLDSII